MDDFIQKTLPAQVCDDFKQDWDGSEKWRKNRAERRKLFLGDIEEKAGPWKNCANVHVPVLSEKILRVAHRIVSEIYPVNEPIWQALTPSQDPAEKQRVENCTLFDNWQFTKENPQFRQQLLKAVIAYLLDGEMVWHSYRDFEKDRNVHEPLMVGEEFIYPYIDKTETIDMSDVPRKTKILHKYRRQVRKCAAGKYYLQTDKILNKDKKNAEPSQDEENIVKEIVNRFEGSDKDSRKSDVPLTFLEQHTWAEIPGIEGDTPLIVTMEYQTKTIVNIRLREYEDPQDRKRYDQQMAEYQLFLSDTQEFMQAHQLEQEVLARSQMPDVLPEDAEAIANQVQAQSPEPPMTPAWCEIGEDGMPSSAKPVKRATLEQFSHGVCIPNPDGSHGIGLGMLLMPFQKTVNVLNNQFIDSATLANSFTAFISKGAKLEKGTTEITPNKFHVVDNFEDLQKMIYMLPTQPANGQLMEAAATQMSAADGISSAPDVLSGEKEGAETYRGQASRVEQATKQLTIIAIAIVDVLSNVAKNHALMNFFFLDETLLVNVLDPRSNSMVPVQVGREMYRGDYHIQFTADMRFASKAQKTAERDDALGMLTKGIPPELLQMIAKPQIIAEAVRGCLKARGMYDLLQHMNSDEEISQAMQAKAAAAQQQSAMMGGAPGGPGAPGAPSIPTGQASQVPGEKAPEKIPTGVSAEGAPGK
jgi:hypothetical protein